MNEFSNVTYEYIRDKAIQEGKIFDEEAYNFNLETAKTEAEKERIRKTQDAYVVYKEEVYFDANGNRLQGEDSNLLASSPGDTRLTTEYLYTQKITYDSKVGDLRDISEKVLNLGISLSHPVIGIFSSAIGLFVGPSDYETYKNVIVTSIHDGIITKRIAEVYQWNGFQYIWAPMATSEKKNTLLSIYTRYFKGSTAYEPSLYSAGQIGGQAGNFFYDTDRLLSLAKNTTSPLYYPYTAGTYVPVQPNFPY